MDLNFGLNLTQEQKLVMTQEMQLSVKLLQMSSFELKEYVEKEIQENPILDVKEIESNKEIEKTKLDYKEIIKNLEFDNYSHSSSYEKNYDEEVSPFNFISKSKSLKEYLIEQIEYLPEKDYLKRICVYIVGNIDSRGYLELLEGELEKQFNISSEIADYCIKQVQSLEPDGIGARDLKECLKIQLKKKNIDDENIINIIDNYLELIAENRYDIISKELNIDIKEAQEYGDIIKGLNPKPSRGFYTEEDTKYILPDAYIKKIDNDYFIIMNDDLLPKLTINSMYRNIIKSETNEEKSDKDTVKYVKDKLNSAVFLIKSIQHRKTTIYRVLEKILELQRDYFDYGDGYLKPMTLKEISESLDMHESTISRAIRDKYIYTNRGTVKIKDLFTTGISTSKSGENVSVNIIKKQIKDIIDGEDKKKPLSDQAICNLINKNGMNISRRTVAKYREQLGIKSSKGRKRF
ncbi:RNA polymerase factor sigma-54 [Clostridium sp. cel8]|jgi:RNA polymerase sigma-54 factor|uniref:RNA polymerase factor sigma-54 n=1 Tax=unclassified Clostridium TaxID=2614128 RepID=UPI0015F552D4|nr:RNA polymerase factor sigma-54 [Clostridium sp. cel8]MBA5851337.1 RNA polymerase factor sigma-54 [Clostridium sp. cel8]